MSQESRKSLFLELAVDRRGRQTLRTLPRPKTHALYRVEARHVRRLRERGTRKRTLNTIACSAVRHRVGHTGAGFLRGRPTAKREHCPSSSTAGLLFSAVLDEYLLCTLCQDFTRLRFRWISQADTGFIRRETRVFADVLDGHLHTQQRPLRRQTHQNTTYVANFKAWCRRLRRRDNQKT